MFQTKVSFITHLFSSENLALYEITWQNVVEPETPQVTTFYVACALHAGYRQTLRMCNKYTFSTAMLVS